MKSSRTMLTVVLLLAIPRPVAAQDPAAPLDAFVKGARIRLASPWNASRRIVGTVADARADSVVVDTADVFAQQRLFNPAPVVVARYRHVTLPIRDVDSVEVSMGRSRVIGMLRGGAIGALAGGAWAGLASMNGQQNPSFARFAGGFASGALLGVGFGVPLGYIYRVERWRMITRTTVVRGPAWSR